MKLLLLCLVVIMSLLLSTNSSSSSLNNSNRSLLTANEVSYQFEYEINLAGHLYDVPTSLIVAVIKAESNFNPQAISSMGAAGLMQLMPSTAKELGVRDSFCPLDNIVGGTRYLRQLYDRFGTWRLALIAYNWGQGNLIRKGIDRMPRETSDYLKRVERFYGEKLK